MVLLLPLKAIVREVQEWVLTSLRPGLPARRMYLCCCTSVAARRRASPRAASDVGQGCLPPLNVGTVPSCRHFHRACRNRRGIKLRGDDKQNHIVNSLQSLIPSSSLVSSPLLAHYPANRQNGQPQYVRSASLQLQHDRISWQEPQHHRQTEQSRTRWASRKHLYR